MESPPAEAPTEEDELELDERRARAHAGQVADLVSARVRSPTPAHLEPVSLHHPRLATAARARRRARRDSRPLRRGAPGALRVGG